MVKPQLRMLLGGSGQRATVRGLDPFSYTSNLKDKRKVLDFIKSGGQTWTVDGTVFEMWLGAL